MNSDPYRIILNDVNKKEAEQASADLARIISKKSPDTEVRIENDNKNAMDLGATLVLVLGTGAAIAIADGIKAWLSRWQNVSITIETSKGKIIAERISRKDISKIEEILSKL